MMRSRLTAGALAAVLALGMAACGDDDGGGGGEEASPEAGGATTTTAAASSEACDATLALGGTLTEAPEGPPTPEFIEALTADLDAVIATGDEAFAGPAQEIKDGLEAGAPDEEAIFGTYGEMARAVHEDCGFESADVTAVDYAFEGVPENMPAGPTSIALTNEGNEEHEMVLFRRNDGETRPIEELLELPEAEVEQAVTFKNVTFASPGETGYLAADLEAGSYVALCFIPVGGGEQGPPHFTEGMVSEFEVS
jgi:hypothetical protein